jgi:two-component system NarL family sensor kinase
MAAAHDTQIALIFIIGTVGMLVMASAVVLFVVFYQKRMLQARLERLAMETDHQQKMLRAALESQENERIRVSKDLHDDIGMMLMTMRAYLNSSEKTFGDGVFAHIRGLVDDTHETVRRISWDLMPSTLERFGLVQTVKEMCGRLSTFGEVPVEFIEINTASTLTKEQETLLYRIVQEAVTNALRHAQPKKIDVRFVWSDFTLEIFVEDDGIGLTLPENKRTGKSGQGLGLINIESRVSILGAQVAFENNIPTGTILKVKLNVA